MNNELNKLAINGGSPARSNPNPPMFPGGMNIDEREEQAVLEVLRSKRLFRYYGPGDTDSKVEAFEQAFAKKTGVKYTLGLNSCTNALGVALMAAGINPGDEVIVPAYTFIATPAAIVMANAIPVIVEVDDSLTIDPEEVERNITDKTKAIMPVHMRGAACNMDAIMAIAKKHGLKVIEDAAQANGGKYNGRPVGSIGDAGCFSFQFHKIITAGEGGAITTNDEELIERAKSLHDTGANWREDFTTDNKDDFPVFPGFNCRMSELTGAMLLVQLEKRDGFIKTMQSYAARINEAISAHPNGAKVRHKNSSDGDVGVCSMFFVENRAKAGEIAAALEAEGIPAETFGGGGIPDWHIYSYWHHILSKHGNNDAGYPFTLTDRVYSEDMCPKTTDMLRRAVHIDVNPLLAQSDIDETVQGLHKVLDLLL